MNIAINPQLYDWAIQYSGRGEAELEHKCKLRISQWRAGTRKPTLKQLEKFAKATYVTIGELFLSEPPPIALPIADFRTFENTAMPRISANLLDTIYDCQLKQDWYESYCQSEGEDKNTFVGSFTLESSVQKCADAIRKTFFAREKHYKHWDDAFRNRKAHIEDGGVLVMTSGVALGNTHRPLDAQQFRGFALSNDYAPLIFVNAKDTNAARSFTLIHELAHIALGESGISNDRYEKNTERWCNAVAGEVLVPREPLQREYNPSNDIHKKLQD